PSARRAMFIDATTEPVKAVAPAHGLSIILTPRCSINILEARKMANTFSQIYIQAVFAVAVGNV
ncbi:MAG: hypothetical protein AABN33_29465, partial [Acidobacteriota bacterium]